jgi:hypothetical protein
MQEGLDLCRGRASSRGVTQEELGPWLEGEQEQLGDDYLGADCTASSNH